MPVEEVQIWQEKDPHHFLASVAGISAIPAQDDLLWDLFSLPLQRVSGPGAAGLVAEWVLRRVAGGVSVPLVRVVQD